MELAIVPLTVIQYIVILVTITLDIIIYMDITMDITMGITMMEIAMDIIMDIIALATTMVDHRTTQPLSNINPRPNMLRPATLPLPHTNRQEHRNLNQFQIADIKMI